VAKLDSYGPDLFGALVPVPESDFGCRGPLFGGGLTGCWQCPVPCRQSPSFEKAAYDLYHQQALSEWGKVLHDEDLAAAILDRVLERGRFIQLDGPSGRTRHLNLEEVWPATAERLRFSGINGSEFLKRTVINPHTTVEQPHT
jgi:hypothetical protein